MVSGASRCGHRGNFGAADRNGAEPSAHQIDTSVRGNETTSSLRHDDHSLQVKEDDPHLTRCALGDNMARVSGRYPSRGPSMSLELRRSPSATVWTWLWYQYVRGCSVRMSNPRPHWKVIFSSGFLVFTFAVERGPRQDADVRTGTLIAAEALVDLMSGDEAIPAGVAGPEIADHIGINKSGCFGGDH